MKNYSDMTEKVIEEIKREGTKPTLLLHSCCAPCSSYVLEYLSIYFDITLYYYNPNIYPKEEFVYRLGELERFVKNADSQVRVVEGRYEPEEFFKIAKGREEETEGNERCFECYRIRLEEAGRYAAENNFDYFTTTLSISPYKNAEKLNTLGGEISKACGVRYLFSDFKKKNGYKRSIELSKEHNLYRQDYCGCIYSKAQREKEKNS